MTIVHYMHGLTSHNEALQFVQCIYARKNNFSKEGTFRKCRVNEDIFPDATR
jgi:hypothetical protein